MSSCRKGKTSQLYKKNFDGLTNHLLKKGGATLVPPPGEGQPLARLQCGCNSFSTPKMLRSEACAYRSYLCNVRVDGQTNRCAGKSATGKR